MHTFSITKLASSGIVLLHLQSPISNQAAQQSTCSTLGQAEDIGTDTFTAIAAANDQPCDKGDLAVSETILPSRLPVQVVLQIFDDLQAGSLVAPE